MCAVQGGNGESEPQLLQQAGKGWLQACVTVVAKRSLVRASVSPFALSGGTVQQGRALTWGGLPDTARVVAGTSTASFFLVRGSLLLGALKRRSVCALGACCVARTVVLTRRLPLLSGPC